MRDASKTDPVFKTATHLTRRAHLHLYWEVYAPIFATAILSLAVFLMGSFGGVWERIGDPWRFIALGAVIVTFTVAVWRARQVKRPNVSLARRRVEEDNDARHRPLDTLYDAPALSRDLWPLHFSRARKLVTTLSPSKLRPALAPLDKYYLRFLAPATIVLALMVGAGDNMERLRHALTPVWQTGIHPSDITFEAWIDPPDYTGRPPIYFKGGRKVTIPEGAELVARIYGSKSPPRLKLMPLSGTARARYLDVKRLDSKTFEARTVLTTAAKARWRVGSKRQVWDLNVVKDRPPTLDIITPPTADKRDRLTFEYSFEDDYGVEALELHMQLLSELSDITERKKPRVEIVSVPLQSASVKRVENREALLDLTKHVWAGRKVSARIVARDGRGQKTSSDTIYFTVPDKIFIEALAKAVIENRRLVLTGREAYAPLDSLARKAWDFQAIFDSDRRGERLVRPRERLDRAPETIKRAALLLDAITDKPAGVFEDPALFMGLRNALGRIRYAREQEDLAGLPADLWSMALRAEFGVLGTALEEMRAAEQNLREGMSRRAPQREVDTLFDRYNEAVERYMEELRKKALEAGNIANANGGGGGGDRNTDEIEALLKAIEEANRIGDVDGARRSLARLAEFLENMQIQLAAGQGQGDADNQDGEMSEEMREALEEMADLLGEQRELKDETTQAERQERASQSGDAGEGGESEDEVGRTGGQDKALSPEDLAARQKSLEEALEKLSEALEQGEFGAKGSKEGAAGQGEGQQVDGANGAGEDAQAQTDTEGGGGQSAEEALADAARAMLGSREALSVEDLAEAGDAQDEAIAALRNAGKALSRAAQGQGEGERDEDGEDANPLGQNANGFEDENSEADVEGQDNAARSRELLEELRRRAAEQEREQNERDYIERLLKRF